MQKEIDIFVSYKSEERSLADFYRSAFIAEGYSVVSDVELIDGGDFGKAIDKMIRSARLVVVLWTQAATKSDWVISEARLATSLNKYQGVWLAQDHAPVDLLPVGLFDLQHHEFAKGMTETAKVRDLLDKIRTRIGAPKDAAGAAQISNTVTAEMTIYESVASLNKIEAYQGYIDAYPQGLFREDAEKEIKNLSSWRTRVRPFLPSLSVMSLAVGVAGLGVGYMQVPPEKWQLDAAKDQINALSEQVQQKGAAQTDVTSAQDAQRRAEAALASVIEDRNTARKERDGFSGELQAKESDLSAARNTVNALSLQVTDLSGKLKQLEQDKAEAEGLIDQLRASMANAESSKDSELASMRATLADRDDAISALQRELSDASSALAKANADRRAAQREVAEAERKVSAITQDLDAALAELRVLKPVTYVECKVGRKDGVEIDDDCFALDTETLDLESRGLLNEADLAGVAQLQDISEIRVTWIENDFAEVFEKLPNLKIVWASFTPLSSLDWAKDKPNLVTLMVGDTRITDLEPIVDLQKLRHLNVKRTQVDDVSALKQIDTLALLYLPDGTKLKDDALRDWLRD